MAAPHWLALFGLILAAWTALFAMAVPPDLRASAALTDSGFWISLCTISPGQAGLVPVFAMWALMSAAMMAPTVLPALATFDDLTRADPMRFAAITGGFLFVWLAYSLIAATAQLALVSVGWVGPFGDSQSKMLSAALLLLAGLYQFSALKDACLSKCRQPMAFFMAEWRPGGAGAALMGLRLGMVCLGCCWALMTLAFVGGTMNLAFMGLATLIMILEKLPDIGRWLTWPLGVVLIASAFWIALSSSGLI